MWPLVGITLLLWYAIGSRMMSLRRGGNLTVRLLLKKYRDNPDERPVGFLGNAAAKALRVRRQEPGDIRRYLDEELFPITEAMGRFRTIIRTIVLIAPLAGLLGTVMGMIEMFASLGTQTFYSQSGGVANGISQALLTTEFGLLIAVPGMIVGRLLDRREDKMKAEIEQIKDYLNSPAYEGIET